jgi:hypothetical protein
MRGLIALLLVLVVAVSYVAADLPVHCLFSQIQGTWELQLTKNGQTKNVVHTCKIEDPIQVVSTVSVRLDGPDGMISFAIVFRN